MVARTDDITHFLAFITTLNTVKTHLDFPFGYPKLEKPWLRTG